MELSNILQSDAVRAGLKVGSKKRLLQELAEMAADLCTDIDAGQCLYALQEREALGPTGMGDGIAVPHARLPHLPHVIGFFARLEKPVDFSSVDGRPVDLVFMLLAPEDAGAEHLRALARVSRTLRNADVCRKLRSTDDAGALHMILTEPATSQAA
ncbi:PTS IIA-like nitrogen regulatory protein PtsN [Pontivivens insulae]|uniref:Nitrogen regulatory protein n=1 Tax=Pontivivens insulae TaxID=1639689 RepID=A0A2R8A8P2_9RHOB|nr:PTS IIA-like nitrogen regulatory protein PtsN [Pontivivens insulae]RED18490.1 phosphotransferase IIA-like nitrogen-regulatory protein PtsN [Pontivivens insulae]SPF28388.1 Nitrogen regulatory protein [Pontivivens insulae]